MGDFGVETARHRLRTVRPQIAWAKLRPAQRPSDRKQEVVELNLRVPVREEPNKKEESLEVKVRPLIS